MTLVVFDVDGTLVDSHHVIATAMIAAFAQLEYDPPPAAAIRRIVGLSLIDAVAVLEPGLPPHACEALAAQYKRAFLSAVSDNRRAETLFPGAADAVGRLASDGYFLGIATGKSQRGLQRTLDHFGLRDHFHTMQTGDRAPSKPSPVMVQMAMTAVGVKPHETLVVGDTCYDVEMARRAGAHAIGVTWGNHPPTELLAAGALEIIERFDDLDRVVERVLGSR